MDKRNISNQNRQTRRDDDDINKLLTTFDRQNFGGSGASLVLFQKMLQQVEKFQDVVFAFLGELFNLHNGSQILFDLICNKQQSPVFDLLGSISFSHMALSLRSTPKFFSALSNFKNLEELSLFHSSFGDEELAWIANSPSSSKLISLNLVYNRITSEGMKSLTKPNKLASLRSLDLVGNKIGDDGVRMLAKSNISPQLVTLKISAVRMSDIGIKALLASPILVNIVELDIGSNKITDEGAKVIATTKNLPRLEILDLFYNRIKDVGGMAIVKSTRLKHLKSLNLDCNRFTKKCVIQLRQTAAKKIQEFILDDVDDCDDDGHWTDEDSWDDEDFYYEDCDHNGRGMYTLRDMLMGVEDELFLTNNNVNHYLGNPSQMNKQQQHQGQNEDILHLLLRGMPSNAHFCRDPLDYYGEGEYDEDDEDDYYDEYDEDDEDGYYRECDEHAHGHNQHEHNQHEHNGHDQYDEYEGEGEGPIYGYEDDTHYYEHDEDEYDEHEHDQDEHDENACDEHDEHDEYDEYEGEGEGPIYGYEDDTPY